MEIRTPDITPTMPRTCRAGGHYLWLIFADVRAEAKRILRVSGVRVLGSPSVLPPVHAFAERWGYFLTPSRQQIELASPPGASRR